MGDILAQYACDACRSRKTTCSREYTGCARCMQAERKCVYSRSGVIHRRTRKRKASTSLSPRPQRHGATPAASDPPRPSDWEKEFDSLREKMPPVDTHGHGPYKVLSSLADNNDAFWRDRPDLAGGAADTARSNKGYFIFEEHAASWADLFVRGLEMWKPLLTSAPPGVLEYLTTAQPDRVDERAVLVLYFGIVLITLPSDSPGRHELTSRLRANLWLAFNDTRLLMEPSDVNIQALVFLASHVGPFTTPSLCWMLMSTACRMLIALAVNHRMIETATQERRLMLFWHLNVLDKSMAFIFPWPPAIHRTTVDDLPLPTLNQIIAVQPKPGGDGRPSLFGAHHMHQMFLLSRVMAGIWTALDEHEPEAKLDGVSKHALDTWYKEALQVLEAAAMTEKPLLDQVGTAAVQRGLDYIHFQYYGALICLTRGRKNWAGLCHDTSLKMLRLLPALVHNSHETHLGVAWQMLYYPWAPFLVLFGEIISAKEGTSREKRKQAFQAMELLPSYLRAMNVKYRESTRLERMSSATLQHARSVLYPKESVTGAAAEAAAAHTAQRPASDSTATAEQTPSQSLLTPGLSLGTDTAPSLASTPAQPHDASLYVENAGLPSADGGPWLWAEMGDMPAWPSNLEDPFADAMFDWFAWDAQAQQ